MTEKMQWQSHVRGLFDEIIENAGPGTAGPVTVGLKLTYGILQEVAQRALELDDPQLNALMCRLAMFSFADPYSKDYNHDVVAKVKAGVTLHKIAADMKKEARKK